jgi:hypothetical protein
LHLLKTSQLPGLSEICKPINAFCVQRLSSINKMADSSIDPTLTRPTHSGDHHLQVQGVPSDNIFNTNPFDTDPSAYQEVAAAALQAAGASPQTADPDGDANSGKRGSKSKRVGPLVRKRSGWNAFYKEQFALYHADHPPETKQNARERKGFSSHAAMLWKSLAPAEKEVYVQRAGEDDALAITRPIEKLRRKRAGLLDTLARVIGELETEFEVDTLVFWSERDLPVLEDGNFAIPEGELFGTMGSTTGSRYLENHPQPHLASDQFARFIQQHRPSPVDNSPQDPLAVVKKRKYSSADVNGSPEDDSTAKKNKSNISRDYHDAEFRRLLLSLFNQTLPTQSQKTRLPRGFFGPYLEKLGLELVGLPEPPVEVGDGGKIGGWSADALRRNLEALKSGQVYIRSVEQSQIIIGEVAGVDLDEAPVPESAQQASGIIQEQEAARILAGGTGTRRGRKGGSTNASGQS